jgi:predicted transglutaminase-like cysteine proteinase
MKKIFIGAAMAILASTIAISSAEARVHKLHVKPHGVAKYAAKASGGVLPPFAYIQFCVHHAGACSDHKGSLAMAGNDTVKLTSKLQRQLASVNTKVNSRMRAVADKGADKWSVGSKSGDCEDFALTKRAMLIAAGWPSRALSMTVVKTAWGEGHAILSVHTSSGTLVLDNLSHSVRRLSSVPYSVVAMQSGSALHWVRRNDS